jgi:hypothetical protein
MFLAVVTSTPAGLALPGAVSAALVSATFLSPVAVASAAAHADGARS